MRVQVQMRMPEFPSESVASPTTTATVVGPAVTTASTIATATNGDMASLMEDIQAKKTSSATSSLLNRQAAAFSTMSAAATATSTNEKHTSSSSSSSAQMVTTSSHSASSSASRMSSSSKKSQLMTHSMSASEMNLKQASSSSASEVFAENRGSNYGRSMSLACAPGLKLAGGPQRVFSVEKLPIGEEPARGPIIEEMTSDLVPAVPSPVVTTVGGLNLAAGTVSSTLATSSATTTTSSSSSSEVTFQQKQMTSSKTTVTTDGFCAEKMAASNQGVKRIQTGDVSYEEKHAASAVASKLETESFSAEKMAAVVEEQFQMKTGEVTQQEQRVAKAASVKVSTENFTAEKKAMAHQAERQTISSHGITHQETHMAASSASTRTYTSATGVSTSSSSLQSSTLLASQMGSLGCVEIPEWKMALNAVDMHDLECLNSMSGSEEVNKALLKYKSLMTKFVDKLRLPTIGDDEATSTLSVMNTMIRKAWAVPSHGNTMGYSLCNVLRTDGGLDLLIHNCTSQNGSIQFCSARVLEQCLTTENRAHVVENGLEEVVVAARTCSSQTSVEYTRVGTGILAHLLKHSEATCSSVIKLGGLKTILDAMCIGKDKDTLRHCANAFANLSLYGDSDSHQAMIKEVVHYWLFPLASHEDDNIRYYACLALATLAANKEIEAAVLKSKTLDLVEPFLSSHNPADFAKSSVAHIHGQSKEWLQHLVPVLNSKRNEARSLAAFHFAMEAGIKKNQGITNIFLEIGAIEPLKKVASSPNAIASRYAALALRIIGEEIPHKLSQQVPLWTVEDVIEWLKQIGFSSYTEEFKNSRVDGDLLLQLTETMLLDDIGVKNGILRKRFMRELGNLKKMADYSSCDSTNLNNFLQSIGPEMSQYTYPLLQAGVDQDTLRCLTDDLLMKDCSIENSIHRLRILENIKAKSLPCNPEDMTVNKDLDVFISYRRSNGSQLASLLKVHLQLRGFSVFIDVERLEAGKFDNNLLESIRKAKHFILVLTPSALDRCIGDMEKKDWVHREIVAALQSQCNIIPITDNFQWPEPEQLPEDMRAVSYFNGVRWIHDYQTACVEKLERFMKGDMKGTDVVQGRYGNLGGAGTPGTPSTGGRGCAHYHRSHSNDSKGSLGSDKDSRDGKELNNLNYGSSNNLNNHSVISNVVDIINSNGLVTSD